MEKRKIYFYFASCLPFSKSGSPPRLPPGRRPAPSPRIRSIIRQQTFFICRQATKDGPKRSAWSRGFLCILYVTVGKRSTRVFVSEIALECPVFPSKGVSTKKTKQKKPPALDTLNIGCSESTARTTRMGLIATCHEPFCCASHTRVRLGKRKKTKQFIFYRR